MPPRSVVVVILVFWIASISYLIYRDYYPWWRTDAPPPFLVELADEAAPLVAQWSIYRGDQKVGSVTTQMTCLKDESIELSSTIEELQIDMQALGFSVRIRVSRMQTIQRVTRKEGRLLSLDSDLHLALIALGQKFDMRATIKGVVKDGRLHAYSTLKSPLGRSEQQLEPIPIEMGNVLNPMQPIAKVPVRPGQHWKMTNVDPVGEALNVSLQQLAQQAFKGDAGALKLKASVPKVLLAQVDSEPREWRYDGKSVSCYVIEYRSDDRDLTGSTWVSVEDGKVMRQEVSGFGEKLVLEREN